MTGGKGQVKILSCATGRRHVPSWTPPPPEKIYGHRGLGGAEKRPDGSKRSDTPVVHARRALARVPAFRRALARVPRLEIRPSAWSPLSTSLLHPCSSSCSSSPSSTHPHVRITPHTPPNHKPAPPHGGRKKVIKRHGHRTMRIKAVPSAAMDFGPVTEPLQPQHPLKTSVLLHRKECLQQL